MKCLTVCQPFATALVYGVKDVENRPRKIGYVGPVLIHVGLSRKWLNQIKADDQLSRRLSWLMGIAGSAVTDETFGCVLGVVDLMKPCPPEDLGDNNWASGPVCHPCCNAMVFTRPFPWRGALHLFEVPDDDPDLMAAMETALTPGEAIAELRHQQFKRQYEEINPNAVAHPCCGGVDAHKPDCGFYLADSKRKHQGGAMKRWKRGRL